MKKCPIDAGVLLVFGETNDFTILKCQNCGFGLTADFPKQIGDYHRDETYIQEETLFRNIFNKRVKHILKYIKKGRVLEIGCSTGLLLSLLKDKGWDVMGVEPSQKAAAMAMKRGIEVQVKKFEEIKFKKRFNLVILNHTFEHLEDPFKSLEKIYSILEKDGLLLIDVPNFGSFSANTMKTKWSLLLPLEHPWHFTSQSLQLLLKQKKYEVETIYSASGVWDYADPFAGLVKSLLSLKKRFFNELIWTVPTWFITKINKGSGLTVLARKTT